MALKALLCTSLFASSIAASSQKYIPDGLPVISVDWDAYIITSKTTTTLQVVVNPLLLGNSSIHDNALESLGLVSADYVRFVPWFPYPKLAVPEIEAPVISSNSCTTSWDFSYADPLMADFFASTPNVSHIINWSTTPDWMWILPSGTTYTYPEDINETDFDYNKGTELRDQTLKELGDYYSRLVSWYVQGGFTDECGVHHKSGHAYEIEYWEVLNEVEAEHSISPEYYNQIYDTIVTAISAVSPNTKFVGLALGDNADAADISYFSSFLNSSNHAAGIDIDFVSYHFYGSPNQGTTEEEAAECFSQADTFFTAVEQIDAIRRELSPDTKVTLNEIGTFDPQGTTTIIPGYDTPPEYFVWSGGVFAYVFAGIARMGIDAIGESQLVGYPGQFPSVTMVNYTTGNPNARLRVLQLLQHSFAPGDVLVTTNSTSASVAAQAFLTADGSYKLLLVNKLPDAVVVQITGFGTGGNAAVVDLTTGEGIWRTEVLTGSTFNVTGWATAVLTAVGP